MSRSILLSGLFAFFILAETGACAVISRDWKTPGDGLLTYDDVNQREWLDLSQTALFQFPGATQEARVQSVLAQLAAGEAFAGFKLADSVEVTAFAQSAGIDTATLDFNANLAASSALIQLLGATQSAIDGLALSIGFLEDREANPIMQRLTAVVFVNPGSGASGRAGLIVSSSHDGRQSTSTGVMLLRDVPEPSSGLSSIVGALFLIRHSVSRRVADDRMASAALALQGSFGSGKMGGRPPYAMVL